MTTVGRHTATVREDGDWFWLEPICTCGWTGSRHLTMRAANHEATQHALRAPQTPPDHHTHPTTPGTP